MRKDLLRFICLLVVSLMLTTVMLTGCSNGTNSSAGSSDNADTVVSANVPEETAEAAAPAEKVKITMWNNYGSDKEAPYFSETIIPMFREKFPNIEVEIVDQGDDQYKELITTSLSTHSVPDLARCDGTDVVPFASQDGLAVLDDLEGFAALKDAIYPGNMSSNLYKGKYYGCPLDTSCKTAIVSATMLAKLGFTAPPKTMEEFITASKAKSPGVPTISVSSVGAWDLLTYFWLFGGVLSDDGFTKTSGYLDGAESVAAVKTLVQLYKDKVLAIKELDGTEDGWEGVKAGRYAMVFDGPWYYPFTPNWKELNTAPALIPAYNGKTATIAGGQSAVIFKDSKHPKAAFELVKFLLSDEIQVLMGENMGLMPTLKSAAENEKMKNNEIWKVYLEQMNTAKARIPSPSKQLIEDTLRDKFTQIFNGEVTAEEGLKAVVDIIDPELAK